MNRQPVTRVTSPVIAFLENDVDTDRIIPARFLTTLDHTALGDQAFYDLRRRPDGSLDQEFVFNDPRMDGRSIMAVGRNFGCGSSREHAVWTLQGRGLSVLLGESFGDIFRLNWIKNGALAVPLGEQGMARLASVLQAHPDEALTVDLSRNVIEFAGGSSLNFTIDPFERRLLLEGRSELEFLLGLEDSINRYEQRVTPPVRVIGNGLAHAVVQR